MPTVQSVVDKLLNTYPWGYEIKDGIYIVWSMNDVWKYDTPEKLIADWYEIMLQTYNDHGFWTDKEIEIAKQCKEVL